ncbi:hypothetical protein ACFVYN_10335, partial [Streptomyces sp. NPDC058307]
MGGVAALAAFAAVGGAVVAWLPSDTGRTSAALAPVEGPESQRTTGSPEPDADADAASDAASDAEPEESSASPSPSTTPLPQSGPGTFVTAPGGSERVGKGTPLRYRVEVEKGITISPEDVG